MKIAEDIDLRWMIRRDDDEIIKINQQSGLPTMTADSLLKWARKSNSIGMVADTSRRVVGFILYELRRDSIHIERMAVAPSDRRCGIGAAMIDRLIGKLHNQRRKSLTINCDLSNLEGLEFLRRNGFIATSMRGDVVEMTYSIDPDLTVWKP